MLSEVRGASYCLLSCSFVGRGYRGRSDRVSKGERCDGCVCSQRDNVNLLLSDRCAEMFE